MKTNPHPNSKPKRSAFITLIAILLSITLAFTFVANSAIHASANSKTDQTGITVARYTYDAWGNVTITHNIGNIAHINPFRYRGYYMDRGTGFYYLQTRFYDPRVRRFINADN